MRLPPSPAPRTARRLAWSYPCAVSRWVRAAAAAKSKRRARQLARLWRACAGERDAGASPALEGRTIHLKSIDLFGFKTFADRTRLYFEPGIAAIVGPNGSGKSNIVDAARWVLGEQSAKQLRGTRMDEVIFAGNDRRRPLGMAEVTLGFDNSDGALSTPFAEIAVTRRLYRTGESEYFINKTQVRLRDVIGLLLGTGLGPDAAAIVSQGEIDAVLSAKPLERRQLFEEAAGTSKYQARKKEAQRRLEQTDANAVRLNDLVVELDKQLPAIEQQVRRAKRHSKLTQRLRDLQILSFVRKTAEREAERGALRELIEADERERAHAAANRGRLQAAAARAADEEYQATLAVDERNGARITAASAVQEIAAQQASAAAHADEAQRRCAQAERDSLDAASKLAQSRARVEKLAGQLETLRVERDEALRATQQAARAENEAARAWHSAYDQLRAVEAERASAAGEDARNEAMRGMLEAGCTRLRERVQALDADLPQLERALRSQDGQVAALERAFQARSEEIERLALELAGAEERKAQAAQELEAARTSLERARAQQLATEARCAALQQVHADRLDIPDAVRAVLDRLPPSGVLGTLAGLIVVQPEHARAIDAALGAHAYGVVTQTAATARACIDLLASQKAGRATFLPLDRVASAPAPANGVPRGDGVIGTASQLVRCEPALRPLVDHLLREVIVVTDLAAALQLARRFSQATLVTAGGDLVQRVAVSGGSADAGSGALARRALLDALLKESRQQQAAVDRAAGAAQDAAERTARGFAQAADLSQRHTELRLQLKDDAAQLAAARAAHAELEARSVRLRSERAEAAAALQAAQAQAQEQARSAARAAALHGEQRRCSAAAAQRADKLLQELARLREAHRTAAALAAGLVERVAKASDDVEAARNAVADWGGAVARCREALSAASAERESLRLRVAELEAERGRRDAELRQLDAEAEALRSKRDELAAQAAAAQERLRTDEQSVRENALESESRRIRLAEIDAETAMLRAAFAEHPASPHECAEVAARLAAFEGDPDVESRRLREEQQRLGNVNLNAAEDEAALAERRNFLRQQLEDVVRAREQILAVISDIDAESTRQFLATFETIAGAFSRTFARLFAGGSARMELTQGEDPSSAGVEISAQPPGKKMQNLNLLSGGERAMTAVALLFAIIQVRPSPFYIFDEVDAALDEANIERFGQLLRELAARAQTIIVTHNKATMTLADRLYGITMGEPGVSSVLSMALEQVSA
jgi:chromosome segregation protein